MTDRHVSGAPETAYATSIAVQRAVSHHPVNLAFLDIDSTLTGDIPVANAVRNLLEQRGYVVTFVTSRSEEMIMSAETYAATRAHGFLRPPPHLGHVGEQHVYVPPEDAEPRAVLDGDVIAASTGTGILVRQQSGYYLPDRTYQPAGTVSPVEWRREAIALIERVNGEERLAVPAAIEDEAHYEAGDTDIWPPDYRIQLEFETAEGEARFVERLSLLRHGTEAPPASRTMKLIDDSEPRKGYFKAFLVPRRASKARAAHHIALSLCRLLSGPSAIRLLFVGDSFPDLQMGLYGGIGFQSAFFLAGRSRLTEVLTEPNITHFVGEGLAAVKRRLTPSGRAGEYTFQPPMPGSPPVRVIIGDQAYPGSEAVESVLRFLHAEE